MLMYRLLLLTLLWSVSVLVSRAQVADSIAKNPIEEIVVSATKTETKIQNATLLSADIRFRGTF